MLQVEIDQNLAKFENFIYFDLQWLELTFKQQKLYIFGFKTIIVRQEARLFGQR
jgi:hypothetical protein